MRKIQLLNTTALIRSRDRRQPWDRKFRLMRDPDGHDGASMQTQADGSNNTGGNSGATGADSQQSNNGGQAFDLAQFWNGSDGDGGNGAPPGESAPNPPSPSGQQSQPPSQQPQQSNIADTIKGLNFGNSSVMSEDVMKDLAAGKTESFQTALNHHSQQVVTSTIQTLIPVLTQMRDQMQNQIQSAINGTLTNRDNMSDLFKEIPSADTPQLRPQVESIFNRAMVHTKNDRKAAIAMTKDMLRFQTDALAPTLGTPPKSAGEGGAMQPSNTNWFDELGGRS